MAEPFLSDRTHCFSCVARLAFQGRRNAWLATGLFLGILSPVMASDPARFETDHLRLEIAANGTLKSLCSRHTGKEYAFAPEASPIAVVYRGGKLSPEFPEEYAAFTGRWVYQGGRSYPATHATLAGDTLTIDFGQANVRARYRVRKAPAYLAFELLSLEGEPVDRIDLLRLDIKKLPRLGQWVNAACDDHFGFCLWAGNLQTDAQMEFPPGRVLMRTTAEESIGFPGATAILFGSRNPKSQLLDAMAHVEQVFGMPDGAARRQLSDQRESYLWADNPTPENIDQFIHWAKRGGFRLMMLSYTSFSEGAGHFKWNSHYPNGMADLKKVTDAIRAAGLEVGMHLHYNKVHKSDTYVTPKPDDRLHKTRVFTLASRIDSKADQLHVSENPQDCTLDDDRRILKVGDELIAYVDYSTEPPYRFTGCQRGYLGTTASSHDAGKSVGLLNVDTWTVFIRIDQEGDLQDEIARRIAEIYRETGPYKLVYFDGAEDVHEPFWHHVAASQHRVYRLLQPPPPVTETAHYTHFSWHMITRSNAYDTVVTAEGMKDFCRLMPCPTAAERVKDFSRIDFGWLGNFGAKRGESAGPDVWEYIASRAAAWDCPLSLHLELKEVTENPRLEDCFNAIKLWEDARLANQISDSQRAMLRNVRPEHAHYVRAFKQDEMWKRRQTGQHLTRAQQAILADRREHHLFLNEQGRPEIVEIQEIPDVAGGAVKAYHFQRSSTPEDAYLLVWATGDEVTLKLPETGTEVSLQRPFGAPGPVKIDPTPSTLSVGPRMHLVFSDTTPEQAVRILLQAKRVKP